MKVYFLILIFSCWLSKTAFAVNEVAESFSLSGQVLDVSTGNPILDTAVNLKIQILDPSKNCLLYEEQQNANTTLSDGHFHIQVGSQLGDPKRTGLDPGRAMAQVFQNTTAITAAHAPTKTCPGLTYTPIAYDGRAIHIIVTPSSTGVPDPLLPDIALGSSAYAKNSQTLQGLSISKFVTLDSSNYVGLGITAAEKLHVQGTIVAGPKSTAAGNAGKIMLRELVANGTDSISFLAPDSIGSNLIWTLPNADGTSGYYLTTNGGGILSLASQGNYLANGTVAFTGNVRLGNMYASSVGTAARGLSFGTDGTAFVTKQSGSMADNIIILNSDGTPGTGSAVVFESNGVPMGRIYETIGNSTTGNLYIEVQSSNTLTEMLRIRGANKNVGVGVTSMPGSKFQVGEMSDGSVAVANTWGTFSDLRLKNLHGKIENACEKIDQINAYTYFWKKGKDRTRQIGVIAQEVEAIFPELVYTRPDGIKAVNYSGFAPVLIEATKEIHGKLQEHQKQARGVAADLDLTAQSQQQVKAWICQQDASVQLCK